MTTHAERIQDDTEQALINAEHVAYLARANRRKVSEDFLDQRATAEQLRAADRAVQRTQAAEEIAYHAWKIRRLQEPRT